MTEAYPLQWPAGWPRARYHARSNFKNVSIWKCYNEVHAELRRLGAKNIVVSTNMETKLDGTIRTDRRTPEDPGVAVYFILEGREQCIPVDRWNKVEDNLRAIAKTIEAMRGIERWGAKNLVDAAFRGFQALPPPDGYEAGPAMPQVKIVRGLYEILEIDDSIDDSEYVSFKYRQLAKKLHPDAGGSQEAFQELQEAFEQWQKTR